MRALRYKHPHGDVDGLAPKKIEIKPSIVTYNCGLALARLCIGPSRAVVEICGVVAIAEASRRPDMSASTCVAHVVVGIRHDAARARGAF